MPSRVDKFETQPRMRWDEIEFKIEKGTHGLDIQFGRKPQGVIEAIDKRFSQSDYILFAAVVIGLLHVLKK